MSGKCIKEEAFLKLPKKARELFWGLLKEVDMKWDLFFESYNFEDFVCNSPIEAIFYFALCVTNVYKGFPFEIERQVDIETEKGNYRVDFIVRSKEIKVVIECDGHEFHEKTKEQVAYGNDRDLNLKIEGYEVIHFSGSQIYNEPIVCCTKVMKYFKSKES